MTTQDLINQLPHTTLWAAAEAVRQGVMMYHASESERDIQDALPEAERKYSLWNALYNDVIPGFAEILFCIFHDCTATFRKCIERVGLEVDPAECYDKELLFVKFCEAYAEMNGGNAPHIRKFQ